MKIIRIPKTPANAFDKHREVSDLVRNQLRHAHKELTTWVAGIDPERIQTEQQASDFIRTVTRILHPEGTDSSRLAGSPAPKSGVWLTDPIAAPARTRKRKKTQARARTRPRRR